MINAEHLLLWFTARHHCLPHLSAVERISCRPVHFPAPGGLPVQATESHSCPASLQHVLDHCHLLRQACTKGAPSSRGSGLLAGFPETFMASVCLVACCSQPAMCVMCIAVRPATFAAVGGQCWTGITHDRHSPWTYVPAGTAARVLTLAGDCPRLQPLEQIGAGTCVHGTRCMLRCCDICLALSVHLAETQSDALCTPTWSCFQSSLYNGQRQCCSAACGATIPTCAVRAARGGWPPVQGPVPTAMEEQQHALGLVLGDHQHLRALQLLDDHADVSLGDDWQ